MNRKIAMATLACLCAAACVAQSSRRYVIDGELTRDSLRNTPQAIKKVYLKRVVNGEEILADSSVVTNRRFHFEGIAPEYVEAAMITGFDNGAAQFLLEPGNIKFKPFDGHFPVAAKAYGTKNNDVFAGYARLYDKNAEDSKKNIEKLRASLPDSITSDDRKYLPYHGAMFNANGVYYKADVMDYFLKNVDCEASLFILKYDLYYMFKPQYLHDVFMAAVPESMRKHPLYKELENHLLSSNMAEGSPAPDFTALTTDGKSLSLSQLRGKYVFLDIWASWCAPCRREIPFVKQALAEAKGKDNFKVLSYSIDSKRADWVNCIDKQQMTDGNWIHVSTLKAWSSDIIRLYNVRGVPHTVLIDPAGNVVKFNLRGEELVSTVKDILSKPFKAQAKKAEAQAATETMEPFKAATAKDKQLYDEYEAIAKRGDLQEIAKLEARLRFVLDHNDSSVVPYLLERDFLPILDKAYDQRLMNALSPTLAGNEYTKSFADKVTELLGEEDDEKM